MLDVKCVMRENLHETHQTQMNSLFYRATSQAAYTSLCSF